MRDYKIALHRRLYGLLATLFPLLASNCSPDNLAFQLLFISPLSDKLTLLRRTFDERLIALEAGLADPDTAPALDLLVLDVVRAATEEADAAARDAAARARQEIEQQVAAITAAKSTEIQQVRAALDAEIARSSQLRSEIAMLKERLSKELTARREAEAARDRDASSLTTTITDLRRSLDEAVRTASSHNAELAAATERAAAAGRERDAAEHARASAAAERDAAEQARAVAAAERDALALERNALMIERDRAVAERDRAVGAHDQLTAERDQVAADRHRLAEERADFVRSHDALLLQRDTIVHERDDIARERDRIVEERDREIKALREELAKARSDVARTAAPAAPPKPTIVEHEIAELQEDTVKRPKKPAAPTHLPVRKSDRQAFPNALGVQIDGEAALLVDLSVTGAQVLSCSALKPAKTVKMLLPSSESPVLCRGRIVWARLEPTSPGKPIRYRAGMFFTATDQAAVQSFISRHSRS